MLVAACLAWLGNISDSVERLMNSRLTSRSSDLWDDLLEWKLRFVDKVG